MSRCGIERESIEGLLRRYEEWKPPRSISPLRSFDLRSGRDGAAAFIDIFGEFDYGRVPEVEKEIQKAEESDAARIVISFQDVTYMDSSALYLLLHARIHMRADPNRLRFLPSEHKVVRELLEVTQTADAFY